jgi:hypothetical protein
MKREDALPCSQEPATGPYPEPDASNPRFPTLCLLRFILSPSYLRLGLPSGFFPSGFATKRTTWLTHLIHHNLVTLIKYFVKRTSYVSYTSLS